MKKIKKLKYIKSDGYLVSNPRSFVGHDNDDIVDKINELVKENNLLKQQIEKLMTFISYVT